MNAGEIIMGIISIICLTFIIVMCIACRYTEELERRANHDKEENKSNRHE